MYISQPLSLFHEDVPVGMRQIGTEQVCRVVQVGIVMALYCKTDEGMHHIFHRMFVDITLSTGHVNTASYIQKLQGTWPRRSPTA